MEYHLRTKLNGNIAMTSCFHENSFLQRDRSLYKFIWVRHGTLDVEVDHVVMHLEKEEMISLTPLHHVQIRGVGGEKGKLQILKAEKSKFYGNIFKRHYMIQKEGQYKGYPLRTFVGNNFQGGFSDHFPVYIYIGK